MPRCLDAHAYSICTCLCAHGKVLPGFGPACWISALKSRYIPPEQAGQTQNSFGCDFVYFDAAGLLTGWKGAKCHLEVKSQAQEAVQPFRMSANEWYLARKCHDAPRSPHDVRQVYLVVVVASVAHQPRVARMLVDPVELLLRGEAGARWTELLYSPPPA